MLIITIVFYYYLFVYFFSWVSLFVLCNCHCEYVRELTNCANYVEGYFIPADTYAAMKTAIKTKGFA